MIPIFYMPKIKTIVSARSLELKRLKSISRTLNPKLYTSRKTESDRLSVYRFLEIEDWMTFDEPHFTEEIADKWISLYKLQPSEEQLRQMTSILSGRFNAMNYWEDYREDNFKYGTTIEAYMDWFYENIFEKAFDISSIDWYGIMSGYTFKLQPSDADYDSWRDLSRSVANLHGLLYYTDDDGYTVGLPYLTLME